MNRIIIPINPTADDVTAAVSQRFALETTNIKQLKWANASARNSAQTSAANAYTGANDFVAAIASAVAKATAAEQPLVAPYQQAWLNFAASIVKNGSSSDSRTSVFLSASTQLATSWQNIDSSISTASNVPSAVEAALGDIQQVIDFLNNLGSVAINLPLRTHIRATLASDYPGRTWSQLSEEEQGQVTATAIERAGLQNAATALKYLGRLSLGISVILAFWNAADNANNFTATLSKSVVEIGASYAGGDVAGDAFTGSYLPDAMAAWGLEGELAAALIPIGFAIVSGILIVGLVDVLFDLIFGTGTSIPASLRVAITVPITEWIGN
jgi:hypothetical protein